MTKCKQLTPLPFKGLTKGLHLHFVLHRCQYIISYPMYEISVFNFQQLVCLFDRKPVGCDCGEVEDEIVINELFRMFNETLLMLKRSNCTAARDRLAEMNVDR